MSVVKCADSAFPIYEAHCQLPSDGNLSLYSTHIRLVKGVKQEQQRKKRQQKAVKLQYRLPMYLRVYDVGFFGVLW